MFKNEKKDLVQSFQEELRSSSVVLLLDHKKLTFRSLDLARRNANGATKIRKIKNKLAAIAFKGTNYETLNSDLKSEKIFVFGDDLFSVCKSAQFLADANKVNVQIIKCATNQEVFDKLTIGELAQLNSMNELRAKILRVINSVGEKVLRVINAKFESDK